MQHQPLPDAWVEEIFTRLVVRYGAEWGRKWEGIDMGAVKTDWASVLGGFRDHPECIAYALDYLPEKPPTVQQFVVLCNRAPEPAAAPQLEGPPADPVRVAAIVAGLAKQTAKSPVAWAESLRDRENQEERLTFPQREAWRGALATVDIPVEVVFNMTPVPESVIPPAMLADMRENEAKRVALARRKPSEKPVKRRRARRQT